MSLRTNIVSWPGDHGDGSRTVRQQATRRNTGFQDRDRLSDEPLRNAPVANGESDEGPTDDEDEHPADYRPPLGSLYHRRRAVIGALPSPTSVHPSPPDLGRRGNNEQYARRSHSPTRRRDLSQTDEYTSSRRRPSPPALRPSSPGSEDSRSSSSSHSNTSVPVNAPSPASSSAGRLMSSMFGGMRRAQVAAQSAAQSIATPNSNTRVSRAGSGQNGAFQAAQSESGRVRTANSSASGPSSGTSHAHPAHPMQPLPPHAYAPHPPTHAIPGQAVAHAAPPVLGYAPVGTVMSVPLRPLPAGTPVVYGFAPQQALVFFGLRLPHITPSKATNNTGMQRVLYHCDVPACNEPPFKRTDDWEVHVKTHYVDGLAFPCFVPGCPKRYKWLSSRVGHMKKDHPGVHY